MKIKELVTKFLVVVVLRQLKAVDNRQRELVADTLHAGIQRMHVQEQYAKQSSANAARKRMLLERYERLIGAADKPEPPAGATPSGAAESPAPPATSVVDEAYPSAITSATEAELHLAAGQATCCHDDLQGDPLDWPLPCDIQVGAGTICRGVPLRTLVTRMKVLHAMAVQAFPTAAHLMVDPATANAELNKTLV